MTDGVQQGGRQGGVCVYIHGIKGEVTNYNRNVQWLSLTLSSVFIGYNYAVGFYLITCMQSHPHD